MPNGDLNWITGFIWNIADDVLRDVYVRGKYRDVILPMTVIRRLDSVLEPSKEAVLKLSKQLDNAGVANKQAALCQAFGNAFYNISPFTLIGQVFEHARSRQCVLFFDEFDVVGKERGDLHETGEVKRVVSSLLLQIDALPSYVVVVTASNHPELLDRAAWRRFQIRLELPMPKQGQIEEWFKRFETRTGHTLGLSLRSLAQSLKNMSFAEVEDFGTDVMRRIALNQRNADAKTITGQCLDQWKKRFTLKVSDMLPEDN